MTNGRKTTAAALAGAVVLGSAGYALGSGSGDGAASAAAGSGTTTTATGTARHAHGPRGAGLADLASRLGVSETKLRDALEAVRDDTAPKAGRREERFKALADALGKTTAQVQAAFEKVHEGRHDAFAAALAKELGVSAAKVEAALEKRRSERGERRGRGGPREGLADLAQELGVSTAKLRSALRTVRPDHRPGDRDDHRAELAKALGVTEAELEAAQEKARAAHEAEHEQRRKAFAAALAKELGISAGKVEEELGDGPRFGRRGHGPGGPGGGHHGPR